MLICPGVEVVIVMLEPATRLVGAYLDPVLSTAKICPWVVGAVLVPVPPLATFKTPVTLLPERLMGLAVICWPDRDK